MEKYCLENVDPDILLEEMTEVKRDLVNPIPKVLPWKAPFPELDNNCEDSLENTKMVGSFVQDATRGSLQQ